MGEGDILHIEDTPTHPHPHLPQPPIRMRALRRKIRSWYRWRAGGATLEPCHSYLQCLACLSNQPGSTYWLHVTTQGRTNPSVSQLSGSDLFSRLFALPNMPGSFSSATNGLSVMWDERMKNIQESCRGSIEGSDRTS